MTLRRSGRRSDHRRGGPCALAAVALALVVGFPGLTGNLVHAAQGTPSATRIHPTGGIPAAVDPLAGDRLGATAIARATAALADGGGPGEGNPIACERTGGASARCAVGNLSAASSSSAELWQNASAEDDPSGAPPPGDDGAMAFDAYDGYVVYFGASTSTGRENQTWLFSNAHWQNATAHLPHAPPAATGAAMDYDQKFQVVLLFGGCGAVCPENDTWAYTGASGWTNLTPLLSSSPPATFGASLAYAADPNDNLSVLVGGCLSASCATLSNATYGFDGFGWLTIPTPASPPPSVGEGLAYDPEVNGLVRFGGCGGSTCRDGQSWTFHNFLWTNSTTTFDSAGSSPPGRGYSVLTWDELDAELILFGGTDGPLRYADTWALTCRSGSCGWSNLTVPNGTIPALTGASAPSDSTAAIGTMLYGGGLDGPGGAGAHRSDGTYFFEPPLAAAPTTPTSLPARSNVAVSARPSGGSGSYAEFPGSYNAIWSYDGSTATGLNATLNFTEPGYYTILLTVVDRFGVSVVVPLPYVATGPTSAIGGGTEADTSVPLTLTASPATGGNPPYTYQWMFGDGGTASGTSVTHSWTAIGSFPVALYVVDVEGVIFRASETVVVQLGPTLGIAGNRTTLDAGGAVRFVPTVSGGSPPFDFAWSFDDGSRDSTVTSPSHLFTSAGEYTVSAIVTDVSGQAARASENISVAPVLAGTVAVALPTVAPGAVETFSAVAFGGTAPYTYSWVLGNGHTDSGARVSAVYPIAGNVSVGLWINDSVGGMFHESLEILVANDTMDGGSPLAWLSGPGLLLTAAAAAAIVGIATLLAVRGTRRRRDVPGDADAPDDRT